jgi:hypothetical protein
MENRYLERSNLALISSIVLHLLPEEFEVKYEKLSGQDLELALLQCLWC